METPRVLANDPLPYLNAEIDRFARQRVQLAEDVKRYIARKDVRLDLRWNTYVTACNARLLEYAEWQQSLPTLDRLDVNWYDDFYIDRYQTVDWPELVNDQILCKDEDPEDVDEEWAAKFFPLADQIKEEILATGYAGFSNDW